MSAPERSEIDLFVGPEALAIDVWETYAIRVSMLEVGLPWTFSFWHSELPRSAWERLIDPVTGLKCGHRVTFAIDGDAVLSGVVETRAVGDDAADRTAPVFVLSGRDDLGAAVTWDADPTLVLRGRTLGDAIGAVYQRLGIVAEIGASVSPGATVGRLRARRARRGRMHARTARNEAVRASHPRIGERAHQVVERMVRQLGYRVWTTPVEGSGHTGVIVDQPRAGGTASHTLRRELTETGRLTDRSNLQCGRETTSIANIPTAITVFADSQRGDNPAQKIAREVTNGFLLTEAALARVDLGAIEQPRYTQSRSASTEAGAQNEAARLCAQSNEGFRRYEGVILGHRLEGKLVTPNQVVLLTDSVVGIAGERWLITEVEYTGSRGEDQRTKLSLVPEGALSVIPEPEPA